MEGLVEGGFVVDELAEEDPVDAVIDEDAVVVVVVVVGIDPYELVEHS